jgi:hypothetical protein
LLAKLCMVSAQVVMAVVTASWLCLAASTNCSVGAVIVHILSGKWRAFG